MLLGCIQNYSRGADAVDAVVLPTAEFLFSELVVVCYFLSGQANTQTGRQTNKTLIGDPQT